MAENEIDYSRIPRLSDEDRQRRYEELRRRSQMSPIYVVCRDPNIAVRWVRRSRETNPDDITFHSRLGFHIAKEPNPKALGEKKRFDSAIPCEPDGTYVYGDVILMEIARDDYEFYLAENVALSRQLVDNGKKAFRQEASKLDVSTFERNAAGQITR